jgi:hypothetical protein
MLGRAAMAMPARVVCDRAECRRAFVIGRDRRDIPMCLRCAPHVTARLCTRSLALHAFSARHAATGLVFQVAVEMRARLRAPIFERARLSAVALMIHNFSSAT